LFFARCKEQRSSRNGNGKRRRRTIYSKSTLSCTRLEDDVEDIYHEGEVEKGRPRLQRRPSLKVSPLLLLLHRSSK